MLIKRLNSENAVLKSLVGIKEDYVLNNILLRSADPEYKPLVFIGIESKESYETVRDMLLRAMPLPAQGGGKINKQARAMITIANSNSNQNSNQNQSGGKKKSKPKNSIKNLNMPNFVILVVVMTVEGVNAGRILDITINCTEQIFRKSAPFVGNSVIS